MPNEEQLREFLRQIRRGEAPAAALACGRATAQLNLLSCPPEQARQLAAFADRPPPGMSLLKFGSRSVVGSIALADGTPAVLKYYFPKNLHKHLSHGGKRSRCLRSWIAALAFEHLGLPTPTPLAIAEWHQLGGLWLEKSFLATRRAEGISLAEWVKRHAGDEGRLAAMATRLRSTFDRMAAHRISHGDLKATNILVDAGDSPSLVDLDAVEILLPPTRWKRSRQRDIRIFQENWDRNPAAATAFSSVISPP
jgi:tRNA A-37 threonylcarbamoyl transferase component Bud32